MTHGKRRFPALLLLGSALTATLLSAAVGRAVMDATTECLVGFSGVPDTARNGGTVEASGTSSCTFNVGVCVNSATDTCAAAPLKRVKLAGNCKGRSSLKFSPSGTATTCGPTSGIVVKLKRGGKRAGKCKLVAIVSSSGKPRRVDRDVLTLRCNPGTASPCATATTCTPSGTVTCEPLVSDGQGIAGTYQMVAVQGPKLCQTNAQRNRFGPCSTEADCGGQQGVTQLCSVTPFATADGIVLPFPQGIQTIFTIAQEDPAPTCNHSACIACVNPDAVCAGIPGCGATPGQPAPGCLRNQCCQQPGFTIPTFTVPLLGGLCSRLDQYRCGFGVVNSSNPQTGDNEVTKTADTSDPGPDCEYGTADDPPHKPCNTGGSGEGNDLHGKVLRCVGNGVCDTPAGIHYRLAVPSLSTTWQDSQRTPQGQCPLGSTFDPDELIITQLVLNAEFSTAGATSSFADMNGDNCAVAGAGFTNFNRTGPFTLGSPPAAPQPYDSSTCQPGAVCSTAVAAGVAITGGGPLFDTGFTAVLTNGPMTRMPTQSCPCTEVKGCPE
jgi:hypothetical protein